MRVNIYAEELRPTTDDHGDRVTIVHKDVVPPFINKHSAVQILLGDRVIHSDNAASKDDDTPGVKFWYFTEYERGLLVKIFEKALAELSKPEAKKAI
jgi:hypothetical protein